MKENRELQGKNKRIKNTAAQISAGEAVSGEAGSSAAAAACLQLLREKSTAAGFTLSERQLEQFSRYYTLLIEKNKVMNLTALTEPEDVVLKHFVDSLYAYKADLMHNKTLVDVGTGAGFPGLPLKIYDPSLHLVLLDSLTKRLKFLQEVSDSLALTSVAFEHQRAEDAGQDKKLREHFDLAVSWAVARLSVLAEYCLPLIKKGGYFIALKGSKYKEELLEAELALKILGGIVTAVEEVHLPGLTDKRAIIFIRKVKNTPAIYPRKAGTPMKSPLSSK